jgi:hypothetical protein
MKQMPVNLQESLLGDHLLAFVMSDQDEFPVSEEEFIRSFERLMPPEKVSALRSSATDLAQRIMKGEVESKY